MHISQMDSVRNSYSLTNLNEISGLFQGRQKLSLDRGENWSHQIQERYDV